MFLDVSFPRPRRRLVALLLLAPTLVAALGVRAPRIRRDTAVTNDHRRIAGTLRDGTYVLALELRRVTWRPNAPTALDVDVPAFAEAGESASVPGPLIRVRAGTRMHVTLHNRLAERATVHGLHDHLGARDSIVLGPGETRDVRFVAERVGTFAYFARTTSEPTLLSRRDDSQLVAAFIVDPAGSDPVIANTRERLLVITAWDDSLRNPASPYGPRQVYAINGRSWPFTERLTYDEDEAVRWRVLNLSQHSHPMHLHGTYFRVSSRGGPFADTTLGRASRDVVTEFLPPGATMTMTWKADRPGNWLFHCHTINHIDEALRLGEAASQAHGDHVSVDAMMSGLVTAITVRPGSQRAVKPPAPQRQLRLFVTERAAARGGAPSLSYVLQRDAREPARDSLESPGSLLELEQGVPIAITVLNRSARATAVHWHGMELESLYDGVAGWSGGGSARAPIIAPGDSFVAHMTPPRAGTFIYHTHASELAQLTGGLYGAMVVHPRGTRPDPDDRVIVLGDSTADSLRGRTPTSMINGRSDPTPIVLREGRTHRLRFISIGAVTAKRLRLLTSDSAGRTLRWTPVAKDGAELSRARRVETIAEQLLVAGETMDVQVTASRAGEMVLEVASVSGARIVTRVPVLVKPRAP